VAFYVENGATVKFKNIALIVQFEFVLCGLFWLGACMCVCVVRLKLQAATAPKNAYVYLNLY